MDFLLCATHYRLLASMLPPKDLKTRLITEWSTIALVAALMAGFAYQGWRDGVPTDSALLQDLYAASAIFGVVAHCSSVLASVYYLGVVNTLPVHSVELFVHKYAGFVVTYYVVRALCSHPCCLLLLATRFSRVLSLPPAGFISGMVALVVGLVLQCYTLSSTRVFVYSIGLLGGISVCGVGVTLWMYVVARGLMHQQAKATAAGARPVDSSDGEDDE